MQRVRSGVRSAEEALYMRHVGHVLSLCLRLLGDRDEAEDVLQETFLEAFEELDHLRDASKFRRFLTELAVVRAEGLFTRRRTRRFVLARSFASEELSFFRPQPDLELGVREQLSKLDSALATLRDRDRACWVLHHLDGYPLEEVASLLHRPLPIVRRRCSRAERALRSVQIPENPPRVHDERRPSNGRHLLQSFQARRALRGRPQGFWTRALRVGLGVLLVLILVLIGAGRRAHQEALPLTMRDQRNLPNSMLTSGSHHAFDLSDGSRVTLSAGGRVDVLDNTQHELVLALRSGRARFDLLPTSAHRFRVDDAGMRVEVTGESHFTMQQGEHGVQVEVDRGALVLRGPKVEAGMQRLTRGQSYRAR